MNKIKAHPVRSETLILWGDDGNQLHELEKAKNCLASLIFFDKRQIWEVYPFKEHTHRNEYCATCERKNVYVRLCPNDLKRMFGDDIVDRAIKGGD